MAGYEECAPDHAIERKTFPFWTMELIVGGIGSHRGSECSILRSGSVFIYGPGVPLSIKNDPDRPFRKYFIVSNSESLPVIWKKTGVLPGKVNQLGKVTQIISIFDQILNEGTRKDSHTQQIINSLEVIAMGLIARHKVMIIGAKTKSRIVYDIAMKVLQNEFSSAVSRNDWLQQ